MSDPERSQILYFLSLLGGDVKPILSDVGHPKEQSEQNRVSASIQRFTAGRAT